MNIEAIEGRSNLSASMRTWFKTHDYLELSTPTLAPSLIPEPTIHNFATELSSQFLGSRELYLIPSPEVHMKRVIAETKRSVYQFSRCFRNSEQISSIHNPEFTMLEYYTVNADEETSIAITEELLRETTLPGCPEELLPPFRIMTVHEACYSLAGVDLEVTQSRAQLQQEAKRLGLHVSAHESWEETFHRIFLNFVEPNLPQDRPLILRDYPIQIECLAKKKEGQPYRRRWELYMQGVEIANCYDEETDQSVVEDYFHSQGAQMASERAAANLVLPDIDMSFTTIFDGSFPPCSGVALGFDRLLMLQLGRKSLRGVILFDLFDILPT